MLQNKRCCSDILKKLNFDLNFAIYPHILYSIEVYGIASITALDKLHKLNNNILRILLKKRMDSPIKDLYICFNTLPVHSLFKMQILVFVHKCLCINVFTINVICQLFFRIITENTKIHGHETRRKRDLHL